MSKPTQHQIDDRLRTLRAAYPSASSDRRVEIKAQAEKLKAGEFPTDGCYTCYVNSMSSLHLPFCSAVCHEEWAGNNYQNSPRLGRPSIEDCQRRIKEIIKERHTRNQLAIG